MKCFQILNNEVLIINENKTYRESTANFKKDGGTLTFKSIDKKALDSVIYDDQQCKTVVNGKFIEYPQTDLDNQIAAIDTYITAKVAREYIPPTFAEMQAQALNYQYQKYEAIKHSPVWLEDGSGYGFDCKEEDQNNWQVSLTLMENDNTMYKVYVNKNDLSEKAFLKVTRAQMMEAGQLVKAQQYAAYAGFGKVREEIENCTNIDELKPYLPEESA